MGEQGARVGCGQLAAGRVGEGAGSQSGGTGGWGTGVSHPTIWYPIPLTSHQSGNLHSLLFFFLCERLRKFYD